MLLLLLLDCGHGWKRVESCFLIRRSFFNVVDMSPDRPSSSIDIDIGLDIAIYIDIAINRALPVPLCRGGM